MSLFSPYHHVFLNRVLIVCYVERRRTFEEREEGKEGEKREKEEQRQAIVHSVGYCTTVLAAVLIGIFLLALTVGYNSRLQTAP